jgi:colicin import membrane protein
MKKHFFPAILLMGMSIALAHAADPVMGHAPVLTEAHDVVRSRIQAERTQAESAYQRDEAACYQRFAVTDCILQIRKQRRVVLDGLRRQEVEINSLERHSKALEQRERIKEKSSEKRQQEEAARRLEARSGQQEREASAAQKAIDSKQAKPAQSKKQAPQAPLAPGLSADEIAKNKKHYLDKQKEAEAHRLSRIKANQEKAGGVKKPLPAYD